MSEIFRPWPVSLTLDWLDTCFSQRTTFFGMMGGFVLDGVMDAVWTVRRMSHGKSTDEITGPVRR